MRTSISNGFRHPLGDGFLTRQRDDPDGYYTATDHGDREWLGSHYSYHLGEDWNGDAGGNSDLGNDVFAASNGRIDQIGYLPGLGNYITIVHDLPETISWDGIQTNQIVTLYAHLQNDLSGGSLQIGGRTLRSGSLVSAGEHIADMGQSGGDYLAHLHFEVRLGTEYRDADGYNRNTQFPEGWADPTRFINRFREFEGRDADDTTYSLTPATTTVDEDVGYITFTITRSGGRPAETIYFSTVQNEGSRNNGDYRPREDYAVEFSDGQARATLRVFITDDNIEEARERFAAIIQEVPSDPGTFLARSTFRIEDNDEGVADYFYDLLPVSELGEINAGLSVASNRYLVSILGEPDPATGEYRDERFASEDVQEILETRDVDPTSSGVLRVTGIQPALDSLEMIFSNAYEEVPDLAGIYQSRGMLVVRYIGLSPPNISNHSWGIAVDLRVGGQNDEDGDGLIQRGLAALIPYFNDAGWVSGATYPREDSMHFEVSEELLSLWFEGRPAERIVGNSLDNTIRAGSGRDQIFGFDGNDEIFGGSGGDIAYGGQGNDLIAIGAGNDRAFGGSGRDSVFGGSGADRLHGEGGGDTIRGQRGSDVIFGGSGDDELIGGAGDDTATFRSNQSQYLIWLDDSGRVIVDGSAVGEGIDTLDGIETLRFRNGEVQTDSLSDAGNTLESATYIGLNQSISQSVGAGGDIADYFRFVANSDGLMDIRLTGLSADIDLVIYGADGSTLYYGGRGGNYSEHLIFEVSEGQLHYVYVWPLDSAVSEYDLTTSFSPGVRDDFDNAGNTLSTAARIGLNDAESGTVGYGSDFADYFQFTATRNGSMDIQISDLTASLDLLAFSSDGDMIGLTFTEPDSTGRMRFDVEAGQTYYIGIEFYGDISGYSLTTEFQ